MARYLVKEKSFIHDSIIDAGEIIEYSGEPGWNLEPIPEDPPPAAEPQASGK